MIDRLCELRVLKLAHAERKTDSSGEGQDVLGAGKGEIEMTELNTNVDVGPVVHLSYHFHQVL